MSWVVLRAAMARGTNQLLFLADPGYMSMVLLVSRNLGCNSIWKKGLDVYPYRCIIQIGCFDDVAQNLICAPSYLAAITHTLKVRDQYLNTGNRVGIRLFKVFVAGYSNQKDR
jgi:hypothetical protein